MAGRVAARAAAALLCAVVLFQWALALGAPWGEYTQGGGTVGTLPVSGRVMAVVSSMVLLVMAAGLLARAGEGPLKSAPCRVITVVAWFATIYSGIAVVLNLITPSTKERLVWAPIAIVILVCAVIAMVKTRRQGEGSGS